VEEKPERSVIGVAGGACRVFAGLRFDRLDVVIVDGREILAGDQVAPGEISDSDELLIRIEIVGIEVAEGLRLRIGRGSGGEHGGEHGRYLIVLAL
jgi:hypothetical protein